MWRGGEKGLDFPLIPYHLHNYPFVDGSQVRYKGKAVEQENWQITFKIK